MSEGYNPLVPSTFEQSKGDIARLVRHFALNREAYRAPAYKEAHARQEFIDPFFSVRFDML
jgi:hypothetical protein